jgi:hypothetical protein
MLPRVAPLIQYDSPSSRRTLQYDQSFWTMRLATSLMILIRVYFGCSGLYIPPGDARGHFARS